MKNYINFFAVREQKGTVQLMYPFALAHQELLLLTYWMALYCAHFSIKRIKNGESHSERWPFSLILPQYCPQIFTLDLPYMHEYNYTGVAKYI